MELSYHYLMLLNHSAFQKKVYENISDTKLSMGQPKILEFLSANDGCMQKDIAVGCQLEPASVTSILLKMERDGYVERRSEHGNRRSLYVYLTEEGKIAAAMIKEVMQRVEEEALHGLCEEERELLLKLLKRVNVNLLGDMLKG